MQSKIVNFLKASQGYISGEEISRQLKVSRAGIWKYIQELRHAGYDIVAVPHLGYKLVSSPDKLLAHEIQFGLNTKTFGKKVIYYESITSTMEPAFRLGVEGEAEGTVVCAESQTKGKGRLGRSWVSPKGKGIYMSVVLRPPLAPAQASQVTLLSAVAVCEAVNLSCSVNAKIKWPNDILVNDRKLAGILTELNAEMDCVRFLVVGIGINVNTPLGLLPEHSTSLKHELKKHINRIEVLREILRRLEFWCDTLRSPEGFQLVIQRWKELSMTIGRRVRVLDASGEVEGEAVDLDKNGGLVIRHDSGITMKRMSGDVVQVR